MFTFCSLKNPLIKKKNLLLLTFPSAESSEKIVLTEKFSESELLEKKINITYDDELHGFRDKDFFTYNEKITLNSFDRSPCSENSYIESSLGNLHSPDFNDCDSPDVLSVVEFLDKTIEIVNSSV